VAVPGPANNTIGWKIKLIMILRTTRFRSNASE
jgi:hypothetical protein